MAHHQDLSNSTTSGAQGRKSLTSPSISLAHLLIFNPLGGSAPGGHDHLLEWLLALVAGTESLCGWRQPRGSPAPGPQVQTFLCWLHPEGG